MTRKNFYFLGWMMVSSVCPSLWAEAIPVLSRIDAVTVYRGQAMVTRQVELPAQAGELEIVVGDLPAQILGTSLYADADEGVTIRSVCYRCQAVGEATKKEIVELDAEIKDIQKRLYANNENRNLVNTKTRYLDKLEQFSAPTANVELTRGVLNAQTLAELSEFLFEKRSDLTEQAIGLREEKNELNEQLNLLQRKRNELTRGGDDARREAVLFLSKTRPGPSAIRLHYLVRSANWSPAYNIRLDGEGKAFDVEYLAQVRQMSGEDWPDVALTLSTATPNMSAESPLLVPLWLGLLPPLPPQKDANGKKISLGLSGSASQVDAKGYQKEQSKLRQAQRATVVRSLDQSQQAPAEMFWALNQYAAAGQNLELRVRGDVLRKAGKMRRTAEEEGLAVSYELGGRMSLASRSDHQLVQIAALALPGETYYEAVPLLSSYVYHLAEITNDSPIALLNGPYSAYIAGEFVGRGSLPLVARGQAFTLGFGVDTQLRCSRELIDKSDKIAWGSRVQVFEYQLRLENYKSAPVEVRLVDRIPASKTGDIQVEMKRLSDPLSADPLYVRDEKDKGILRWNLRLPAGAAGEKARQVHYSFEMKFAKDKHVGLQAVGLLDEMKKDYDQAVNRRR